MTKTWLFIFSLVFFLSNFLYFFTDNSPVTLQVSLLFFVTFIQGIISFFIYKNYKNTDILKWIILTAIASRAVVFFSSPILEDDFYRYRWDGHVLSQGINPYNYAPNSEHLDHLHTDYREDIGYINIATIYPPLAEYIFAFNSLIFGGHLWGLKILFIFFDLLTGIVILNWLSLKALPLSLSIFYFLNPTVIKEIANSAHLDSSMVFFFTLSLFLMEKIRKTNIGLPYKKKEIFLLEILCFILLALSALIKLVPLFLLPHLLRTSKRKALGLLIVISTLFILSFPLLFGKQFMNGLSSFSKHWVINESLFYPISYITTKFIQLVNLDQFVWVRLGLLNEIPGKLLSAAILGFIILRSFFKKPTKIQLDQSALLIICSLLLLSPVFNPWYVLWFLPFSITSKHPPTILLSMLLVFSYSWYLAPTYYQIFRGIEYSVFFGYLAYWHWRQHQILKQSK